MKSVFLVVILILFGLLLINSNATNKIIANRNELVLKYNNCTISKTVYVEKECICRELPDLTEIIVKSNES